MFSPSLEAPPASQPPAIAGWPDRVLPCGALPPDTERAFVDEEEVFLFPATAAQRRFWLLDQLVPGGNPALNMPLAVRLRGELIIPALERAANETVHRHESLRTTFHCERGQLLQVISPPASLTIPLVDVADFPPDERAQVPAHLLAEEARRPFDLASGPLLRLRLVRVSPREHLLICPMHHVVADGWSSGVFVRELGALYTAFAQGELSPLPDPAIQFADFSQWQSGLLATGGFDAQLDYWRAKLAGELPVLDLPTDRPRLPWRGRSAVADIRERRLPSALTAALKSLAAREGSTPFMLLLAAFGVLLGRYCGGQEDLVIMTSMANRQRLEVEGLIGLFANPLLLRLNLSGARTFRELFGRARRVVFEAFQNADAPFERLVEELQPRRLQVNFLYQQDFVQAERWRDLEATPEDAGSGGAVYEWNVIAVEDAAGVRLHCEYNAELFDASTVERMLADYESLLAAIATEEGLDAPLTRWPLAALAGGSIPEPVLHADAWRLPAKTLAWMRDHLGPATPADLSRRQPLPGRRLSILSHDGQPVPVGVVGELCLSVDGAGESPLRTGDLARPLPDGSLRWIGSADTERKVNGLRVDRQRIEAALRTHPHVRQAAVLWRDDGCGELLLTVYYQGDGVPEALLGVGQMRAFLQEVLPEEWIPAAYALLGHFPGSPDGRLDEEALPTPVRHDAWNHPTETHDAPYLPLHHEIIGIWREILHVHSVSIRDDFFALGGNSLLAMRMLYQIEQVFGKTLLPSALFRRATVEHLADQIIKQDGEAGSRDLIRVQETGKKTPIFYLHGDISGGGFYCVKLARGLGSEQPFYTLPPIEVDHPLEDRPTIEEMAAAHVTAIRSARARGPYIIGGFCLGGLIAYEVACQLEREGEVVERLLVIDAGPSDRRLTAVRRGVQWLARWRGLDANRQLYLFCRWHYLLARWDRFRRWGLRGQLTALGRRLGRRLRRNAPVRGEAGSSMQEGPNGWFDARLDVPLVFLWAMAGYRAKPYAGAMTLLLSSDLVHGAEGGNPAPQWRRSVAQLEVRELAGSHLACITEHVAELAVTVRQCLEGRG